MATAETTLSEWTKTYITHKDVILKQVVSIDGTDSELLVTYKDRKQKFFIIPTLGNALDIKNKLGSEKEQRSAFVILNNKKNLKAVIAAWPKLIEYSLVSIIFANPFSNTDKKWIIFPHTHNKICDSDSLSRGITAVFETVDEISEEEFKKKYE